MLWRGSGIDVRRRHLLRSLVLIKFVLDELGKMEHISQCQGQGCYQRQTACRSWNQPQMDAGLWFSRPTVQGRQRLRYFQLSIRAGLFRCRRRRFFEHRKRPLRKAWRSIPVCGLSTNTKQIISTHPVIGCQPRQCRSTSLQFPMSGGSRREERLRR